MDLVAMPGSVRAGNGGAVDGAVDVRVFPRVGFVVTNLRRSPKRVIKFYNGRGTAEQWIKEGKNALKWTRLSCRRFKDNQTRLQLFALAYNLANFLRQLALPRSVRTWTLTTLREKLIKIGAKVVHHARAVTFQLAEVAVPRALVAALLAREGARPVPPENPMSADRVRWEHIQRVYEMCERNVSETARRLGMHRRTLQRILAKRGPR